MFELRLKLHTTRTCSRSILVHAHSEWWLRQLAGRQHFTQATWLMVMLAPIIQSISTIMHLQRWLLQLMYEDTSIHQIKTSLFSHKNSLAQEPHHYSFCKLWLKAIGTAVRNDI
jgi:hypothetical protein